MRGSVAQLQCAVVGFALARVDLDKFRFGVGRRQSADRSDAQTTAALHLCHHRTERVDVRGQENRVVVVFFFAQCAEIGKHAALLLDFCRNAEFFKLFLCPDADLVAEARRAVDGEQLLQYVQRIIHIKLHDGNPLFFVF